MINSRHLMKVASAWVSIVYTTCYVGVAIYSPIRPLFMRYALHTDSTIATEFLGIGYFVSGLIIWNVVVVAAVGLFGYLYNAFKH